MKPFYEKVFADTVEKLNKYKDLLGELLYRRALHVVSECERVKDSVIALNNGDLLNFGELMKLSHQSLKDNYEVTGKELDTLYYSAIKQKGCIGARMTGAGFGGCTVNLVDKDCIEDFIKNVEIDYLNKIGYKPSFYVAEISDGIIDEK